MRIVLSVLALAAIAALPRPATAQPRFPEPKQCEAPRGDLDLVKGDEESWTPCEKWVWSCIRDGKEANLFQKKCVEPRSEEAQTLLGASKYAPFHQPDSYGAANALRGDFIRKLLTHSHYREQTHPIGIRIIGAYFPNLVNLENVTTPHNLVLDASIFKNGMRLTNFRGEKNLSLDGSNVRGLLELRRMHIDGSLFLSSGVYDAVDARDARIDSSIDAFSSLFNDRLILERAHIAGNVNLSYSWLTLFNAHSAKVGGSILLRRADIRHGINATGASVLGDLLMQRIWLGRKRGSGISGRTCEWNLTGENDDPRYSTRKEQNLLYLLRLDLQQEQPIYAEILKETVLTRPEGKQAQEEACGRAAAANKIELILRDMRISGRVCILDPAGELPGALGRAAARARISLDGQESSSTILHWDEANGDIEWRAVHFKTGYMLMSLSPAPPRHYIDDINIGFIAFLKHDDRLQDLVDYPDDTLCDLDPPPGSAISSESEEAHRGIIKFFETNNLSKSSQPFAMIVERLSQFGTPSSKLSGALVDFKLVNGEVCKSKDEFVELQLGSQLADQLCLLGQGGYKYFSWMKGEPRTIIYLIELHILAASMIVLFAVLLAFDGRNKEAPRGSKLSITYAIDNFHPFRRFRIDKARARMLPQRRWLKAYLRFHRFMGGIVTVLLLVLLYFAIK